MNSRYLFTSESVTEGHPDKLADQISDAVLDDLIRQDPKSHCGCETLVTTGLVLIAGEISTHAYSDISGIARKTIRDIGYNDAMYGFDYKACAVLNTIGEQSPDIAIGVNEGEGLHKEQGAGDQGMMFGYATNETDVYMPLPITLAHRLTMRLAEVRKTKKLSYLRPDGKSQVTVEYKDNKPARVHAIVVSTQHNPDAEHGQIVEDVMKHIIEPVCSEYIDHETSYHINPTGRFIIGGPPGDCGLTGRKIIVDTYGGMGRHGGGAFSGKDPSKVDRSGAYMARYVAKNIVAAGLAERAEVQVAYAIGVATPVSLMVNTFGTGTVSDEKIAFAVEKTFDFRPAEMIKKLDLLRPIYQKTACYGHFGRTEPEFTWERTDQLKALQNNLA